VTAAERRLLLALFRWAREYGTKNVGPRGAHLWKQVGQQFAGKFMVGFSPTEYPNDLDVIDEGWGKVRVYQTETIAEAVDILAALGVIPPRFSTAYQAGWDAGREDIEYPGPAGEAFRAILPAAYLT